MISNQAVKLFKIDNVASALLATSRRQNQDAAPAAFGEMLSAASTKQTTSARPQRDTDKVQAEAEPAEDVAAESAEAAANEDAEPKTEVAQADAQNAAAELIVLPHLPTPVETELPAEFKLPDLAAAQAEQEAKKAAELQQIIKPQLQAAAVDTQPQKVEAPQLAAAANQAMEIVKPQTDALTAANPEQTPETPLAMQPEQRKEEPAVKPAEIAVKPQIEQPQTDSRQARREGDSQEQPKPAPVTTQKQQPTEAGVDTAVKPAAQPVAAPPVNPLVAAANASAEKKAAESRGKVGREVTVESVQPATASAAPMMPTAELSDLAPAAPAAPSADRAGGASATAVTAETPGNPLAQRSESDEPQVAEQAMRGIRSIIQQRGGSVTLRLNPAELGELRIRLDMSNNVVRANFEAADESARRLLSQQISTLKTALEGHGLRVESLQVQTPNSPQFQQHFSQQQGQSDQPNDGRSRGSLDQQAGGQPQQQQGRRDGRTAFERELLDLVA